MLIQEITLNSPNLLAQKHFFTQILGLPLVEESDTSITIQAGTSRLTLADDNLHSPYHYAFDIPENQFAAAKEWLAQRVPILADETGKSEFPSTDWNAIGVYFKDADGNIAELIARHNLPTASKQPFGASSIVRISEIGIVTPDVLQTVAELVEHAGMPVWRGAGSDTFSALGDEQGLFIISRAGRNWLPTSDAPSAIAPLAINAAGVHSYVFPTLPYRIHGSATQPVAGNAAPML